VDECNAAVGLACSHLFAPPQPDGSEGDLHRDKLHTRLQKVQHYLFDLGAHLATPRLSSNSSKVAKTHFSVQAADELETWIDDMDTSLAPLTTFVLPGGHPSAAALHLARTIARRAERAVTPLFTNSEAEIDESAYRFINRLSDFFFVASRYANHIMGSNDVTWQPVSVASER